MAEVVISRYDASSGWLPAICPKHGVPADRAMKRKFTTPTPGWVWLLFLISWLIVIIAAKSMEQADEVRLPGCPKCGEATTTRRLVRWGSGLATAGVLLAGIGSASGGLFLLSLPLMLVWLLAMSSLGESLGAVTGKLDGPWLRLKGVHPAFMAGMRPNPAWNYVPPQPAYTPLPQGWAPRVQR